MAINTTRLHTPRAQVARNGGASPSQGFSMQGRNVSAVIRDLERSVHDLKPQNRAEYIHDQREFWANDYPYRERPYFTLEELASHDDSSLNVMDLSKLRLGTSGKHSETRFRFIAHYKNWGLNIAELAPEFHTDLSITVFNGATHCFHPLEARNQILAHHSEEVYEAWKQKVRAEYQEAIGVLIDAAKQELGTLTAWSAICSPSSERLMKSTPGIKVKSGIAYLIF